MNDTMNKGLSVDPTLVDHPSGPTVFGWRAPDYLMHQQVLLFNGNATVQLIRKMYCCS